MLPHFPFTLAGTHAPHPRGHLFTPLLPSLPACVPLSPTTPVLHARLPSPLPAFMHAPLTLPARPPACRSTSPRISWKQQFFLTLFDKFARTCVTAGRLRLILPDGSERLYGTR